MHHTFNTLEEVERLHILYVLRSLRGNRTHTAEALKISLRCLRTKINLYRSQGHQVMQNPYGDRGHRKITD